MKNFYKKTEQIAKDIFLVGGLATILNSCGVRGSDTIQLEGILDSKKYGTIYETISWYQISLTNGTKIRFYSNRFSLDSLDKEIRYGNKLYLNVTRVDNADYDFIANGIDSIITDEEQIKSEKNKKINKTIITFIGSLTGVLVAAYYSFRKKPNK